MEKLDEKILLDNIGKIAFSLDKAYMPHLASNYGVLCFDEKYNQEGAINYVSNIRTVKVERWVFDRDEKSGECFKNVLSAFADGDHTVALVVKRTPANTEMFFVVKNEGAGRNEDSRSNAKLLQSSLQGNFQGSCCEIIDVEQSEKLFSFTDPKDAFSSIALLTNTPSEYSEDYIGQGLDKLLNGIIPEKEEDSYTVVFLAESLAPENIREILSGYEDMATAINPYLQYQFQTGSNTTETHGEMTSISDTHSVSESVFKTHSVNIGANGGVSKSRSHSVSEAVSNTKEKVKKKVAKMGVGALTTVIGAINPLAGVVVGAIGNAAVDLMPQETETHTTAEAKTDTTGKNFGLSAGYGYSWGQSKTISNATTKTTGTSSSMSVGTSENTTYTYKSYMVADLLDKLEKTIERTNRSQATGLWKYATYVLSGNAKTSLNVANSLRAITQGKDSFMEPAFVQEWSYQESNGTTAFNEIKKYISHFTHPIFIASDENGENQMILTGTSYVATDELSHVIVFPRKSLQGLPVLEGVQFGREPHTLIPVDADMEMGCGYHMHQAVENQRIHISKEELTKHTFITGSTGSGKSNTIYKLLENLNRKKVKFLVVEPAKGEYKAVFGKLDGVYVYGTNPNLKETAMLRLNPFRFPKSIHVLEHLDRLIEIFNVCWPMYAAMPAILKDAVERAYVGAGWDLTKSENRYDENLFPTFKDVWKQIKIVLDESDYSKDNKGDYVGALVTRLRSLTNGINGLIFTTDDLSDEQLFEENVIVDLSRVGSVETKALIMGLLVLKLQEHRMDAGKPNSPLKHVTVLEEAHNLLKRTSTEQMSEGANLLGKSVEMLANSIAEMRTYGEGFVIADQSPGLLDMSVIRNTNTKILLRLPDFSDRELVGKAAGLNENQIVELGRLEKGVASIIQSDWLEPVLCKVDLYTRPERWVCDGEKAAHSANESSVIKPQELEKSLLECIMNKEIYRKGDRVDIAKLKDRVIRSALETSVKCEFIEYITADEGNTVKALQKLVFDFLEAGEAIQESRDCSDITDWANKVVSILKPSIKGYSQRQINLVMELLVFEQVERNKEYTDILDKFIELYDGRGGII